MIMNYDYEKFIGFRECRRNSEKIIVKSVKLVSLNGDTRSRKAPGSTVIGSPFLLHQLPDVYDEEANGNGGGGLKKLH